MFNFNHTLLRISQSIHFRFSSRSRQLYLIRHYSKLSLLLTPAIAIDMHMSNLGLGYTFKFPVFSHYFQSKIFNLPRRCCTFYLWSMNGLYMKVIITCFLDFSCYELSESLPHCALSVMRADCWWLSLVSCEATLTGNEHVCLSAKRLIHD